MTSNLLTIKIGDKLLSRCRYGWMISTGPFIGKCFELYGEYSESEVSVFKTYVTLGDYVIDVGANIGDLTLPLSEIVGATGKVFACESHPEVFNVLCANLALNDVKNVKVINAFIADNPNVDTASAVWGKYAYVSEKWEPAFVALDKLNFEKLNFLKVDVDGSELAVLQSGVESIKKFRPVLYFENDTKEKSQPLLAFVLGLGYRIFFHPAPIFQPDNFYENPVNAWAPRNIVSLMMLALPPDMVAPKDLREVRKSDDWWDLG